MNYKVDNIPDHSIVYEFLGSFNQNVHADAVFELPQRVIGYFLFKDQWHRALSSPFYFEDVVIPNRIEFKKKHQSLGAVRLFLFHKNVDFVVPFSLLKDSKKQLTNFKYDIIGEYSFFIQKPWQFLEQFSTFFGGLKNLNIQEFIQYMQPSLQSELVQLIKNNPTEITSEPLEALFAHQMNKRVNPIGLILQRLRLTIISKSSENIGIMK